jgi:hypothetical protein
VSGARLPWVIAGAAALGVAALLLWPGGGATGEHPTPRDGVTAERVLRTVAVPRTPGAIEAYAAARRVPAVLDGVYCYCDCSKHSGHRSLLTCFESEHGAYCDICMGEAVLAARLQAEGAALERIRAAIDAQFGS